LINKLLKQNIKTYLKVKEVKKQWGK